MEKKIFNPNFCIAGVHELFVWFKKFQFHDKVNRGRNWMLLQHLGKPIRDWNILQPKQEVIPCKHYNTLENSLGIETVVVIFAQLKVNVLQYFRKPIRNWDIL